MLYADFSRTPRMKAFFQSILSVLSIFYLVGCGGGGGDSSEKPPVSSSSVSIPSSSVSSSSTSGVITDPVNLSGTITFEWVPHKASRLGLDYPNTEVRPARSLVVELMDSSNNIIATGFTNETGFYNFIVNRNQQVRVRVKAQLKDSDQNLWNISVRDNTNSNSLYAVQGELAVITTDDEVRDIQIDSGWNGRSYRINRAAPPFAILDVLYQGIEKLKQANISKSLPALTVYWSEKNTTAEGDVTLGEIGTSYYSNGNIYLLGDANVDIDEYDAHVILHEWTHFLESSISRADSLGGDHGSTDKLDMRVAFSEGLANAFAGIMLDDSFYMDAMGVNQSTGFYLDIAEKSQNVQGWYSQGSIGSIVYNYYLSGDNRIAKSVVDLFTTFTRTDYIDYPGFASIFLFSEILQRESPDSFNTWVSLLSEQNIHSSNGNGVGEINTGGYTENLPLYKSLSLASPSVSLCSSNRNGSFNKLSNYQFVKIDITQTGTYRLSATKTVGTNTDPDFYLYLSGTQIGSGVSFLADEETLDVSLSNSTYILSFTDAKTLDDSITTDITHCFNLSLTGVGG